MLALEGKLKKKSERLIAIDLFGKESIEGKWHDGAPERGVVRRRVPARTWRLLTPVCSTMR